MFARVCKEISVDSKCVGNQHAKHNAALTYALPGERVFEHPLQSNESLHPLRVGCRYHCVAAMVYMYHSIVAEVAHIVNRVTISAVELTYRF